MKVACNLFANGHACSWKFADSSLNYHDLEFPYRSNIYLKDVFPELDSQRIRACALTPSAPIVSSAIVAPVDPILDSFGFYIPSLSLSAMVLYLERAFNAHVHVCDFHY